MKITYEIDTTSDKYDRCEHKQIEKSADMAAALYDFSNIARGWVKYDTRADIPADEIQDSFYNCLNKYNIDLDELWV